jgi:cytochrome c553
LYLGASIHSQSSRCSRVKLARFLFKASARPPAPAGYSCKPSSLGDPLDRHFFWNFQGFPDASYAAAMPVPHFPAHPCLNPVATRYNHVLCEIRIKIKHMNHSGLKVFSFLVAALALPAMAQTKGDAAAGKEKIQMCQGCHGIEGWRTAYPEVFHVPRIGGQHEAYLLSALKAYKSGDRNHPSMRAIAGSLSEKDMQDLAAFYASSKK